MKQIWHPYWNWENFHAGFYGNGKPEHSLDDYAKFLSDSERFQAALRRVLREWPKACEHFLSNDSINRIAWLGQASMCIETGVPSKFRAGFRLLSDKQQRRANWIAAQALESWLNGNMELDFGH